MRRNELLVGAVVLAALAAVVAGALWLGEVQLGRARAVQEARFRSVGGLGVGERPRDETREGSHEGRGVRTTSRRQERPSHARHHGRRTCSRSSLFPRAAVSQRRDDPSQGRAPNAVEGAQIGSRRTSERTSAERG